MWWFDVVAIRRTNQEPQRPVLMIVGSCNILAKMRSAVLSAHRKTTGAQLCCVSSGRATVEVRFADMPPCPIGMGACVDAHHLSGKLSALGTMRG
jgi:hypothetical protein